MVAQPHTFGRGARGIDMIIIIIGRGGGGVDSEISAVKFAEYDGEL